MKAKKDNNRDRLGGSGLRKARSELGWSQQQVADRIGTTKVTVNRWENGATFPSPYFRQQLCKVFGKTLAELGLEPVAPPSRRMWTIPVAHTPFFTGRERLLDLLHERLSIARTAALTHPQALYGLGGIGKTRTAVEYAFRYGDDYTHVFWVQAATRDTLCTDFVALAGLLGLPEQDDANQLSIIAAAQRWLSTNNNWLLILDNADDLSLAVEFLPTNHKGHILFTTRSQSAGTIATNIEVERLSVQEGILLLLRWCRLLDSDVPLDQARSADRAIAERIVQEMDGLPLAIVQAGAFVQETGCSLEDYLNLYATHRQKLLARSSRLILDHPDTVATTWSLSFQYIEQTNLAAADLLRFCAFLAPDAIPESLLTRGCVELGTALGAAVTDPLQFNEMLGVLLRYSLIQRHAEMHMLSIHRLIQAVLKDDMDQQTQHAWAERTVRVVNAAFPEAEADAGIRYQAYLPHAQACATLIDHYQFSFPEAAQLLFKAGEFLYFHGFHQQSQLLHQRALAIREKTLGAEHPATAESLNNLGVLARTQGDYAQAERLHQRALAIREKTLGAEHLATAESLNNLGVLFRAQKKYEQAELLLRRALNIREQSLGSEHPNILFSFLNLAKLYTEQRKYEQAESLLQQALTTSERILKPGNPLIAHTLSLLARLSYDQGNYKRAETLWKRSLAILEQTLGAEHPAIAERLNDLAELYTTLGRYTVAQKFCQRALSISEKRLGLEHPDTKLYSEHLTRIMHKRTGM